MIFLTQIFDYIKQNAVVSFFITFFVSALVWIYKENRAIKQEEDKFHFELNNKKLLQFCRLESSISFYLLEQNELSSIKLFEAFGDASQYFNNQLNDMVREFYKEHNLNQLLSILTFVQVEINKTKTDNSSFLSENHTKDFSEFIIKILRPAKPIFYILLAIFIIGIHYVVYIQEPSLFGRVNVICSGLSLFIAAPIFIWFINEIIENTLRVRTKIFICLLLIFCLLPLVAVFNYKLGLIILMFQLSIYVVIIIYLRKRKAIIRI